MDNKGIRLIHVHHNGKLCDNPNSNNCNAITQNSVKDIKNMQKERYALLLTWNIDSPSNISPIRHNKNIDSKYEESKLSMNKSVSIKSQSKIMPKIQNPR